MKEELGYDLLALLKVVSNISGIEWSKGQKPVRLPRLVAGMIEAHGSATLISKAKKQNPDAFTDIPGPVNITPVKPSKVKPGRPIGKAVSPPPTLTVNVGSYGTEVAARQEAREFLHPNVFLYRSGMFPNPVAFGVAALVRNAVAVEVSGKKGSLYPWTVQIEFDAVGDAAKVASWVHTLKSKIRGILT